MSSRTLMIQRGGLLCRHGEMSLPDQSIGLQKSILIVEDSPTQALLLARLLEDSGYDVLSAASGMEALAILKSRKPSLVITDIVMPQMDGYELTQTIKTDQRLASVPVILLTSLSDPDDVIRGLEAQGDFYLTKPYDEDFLLQKVESVLAAQPAAPGGEELQPVQVNMWGKTSSVTVNPGRALSLLASTYENAIQINKRLVDTQKELRSLNTALEDKVKERTAHLEEQILRRERAEEELRETLETSANLIQTIPSGLLTFQFQPPREFFLVECNPEAERLLHMEIDRWRGQELEEVWPNARIHGLKKAFSKTMETGETFKLDDGVYKKGGNTRFFRLRAFRIPGELLGVAFEDVTERTEAEADLRKAHEALEKRVEERTAELSDINVKLRKEMNRRKRVEELLRQSSRLGAMVQMAGSVAENFSTLLQTFSDKTREALSSLDKPDTTETRSLLEELMDIVHQGTRTAERLRQFSRANKEEGESQPKTIFDLTHAVRKAVQVWNFWLKTITEEKGIDVKVDLHLADGCTVRADEDEIVEVMVNVLNNAVEALPEGGTISVRTLIEEKQSVVFVEDDGVGIEKAHINRIFEPFWTSKQSHTGLGLTTSFGIINRHGGTMRIYSQTDVGTRVVVRMPYISRPD